MDRCTSKAALDRALSCGVGAYGRPPDNGPTYLSGELREYLGERGMAHTRGAPHYPQTPGKIERYHQTMKNVVKLQHYYFPWELEGCTQRYKIDPFIA